MSRSKRKAFIKDKPRNVNRAAMYWRPIRSAINNAIRSCKDLEELELPDPKNIINDYTYCDYSWNLEYGNWGNSRITKEENEEDRKKYRRK